MSSVTGHTAHSERPERSRNAKAQARHRAKRKAYIEQLEQTVTKLQTALGFTPEQVSALPPPLAKIRELEQENARLQKENEDLRRILSDVDGRGIPMEITRRNSLTTFHDTRACDRDYKRRKMSDIEQVYMSPTDAPSHGGDVVPRPPPLTIPQPLPHHYANVPTPSHHPSSGSSSMFNLQAQTYQMPNTPSGSSATSSPPFSPAQMQSSHSPVNYRPPVSNHHHVQMTNYTPHSNQYGQVKVEDEHYVSSNHHHPQTSPNGSYPLSSYANPSTVNDMDKWHTYSSERAPIHPGR